MRLGTQLVIGAVLLLAIGGGAVTYHRYQTDGEAEAAVHRGSSAVPVEVVAAEAGTIRERIEAVGSSLARQAVDIVALSSGRVAEINFTPGERVEKGAVLVRLDDLTEQADVAEAEAMRRQAQLALDRANKLRTNNTVAQATVDELEAAYLGTDARLDRAKKQLADRTVRAPFAGVVGNQGRRHRRPGRRRHGAHHPRRPRRARDRVQRAGELLRPDPPGPGGPGDQPGLSGQDSSPARSRPSTAGSAR